MIGVAHITFGLDMGGLEKLLVEFARHADRSRFSLQFVSLGERGRLAEEIEGLGWPVIALGKPSGLHLGLIPRMSRLFRATNVHVVHTHESRALFYGGPAARLVRVPTLIHTRHGLSVGATSRQQRVFRYLARLTDRMICISEDCAKTTTQSGIPKEKVQTIWNGIDLTQFRYTGPEATGPIVIVARLNPIKDIGTLLRAFALALREEPSLRLEIAGDGPARTELQHLAVELGLDQAVTFLGEVRNTSALLQRSRAFALSSTSEGISLTLLEAMAVGLPIVATNVGGNPEVVIDGRTGLLVAPNDPQGMARALLEIWRAPERSGRMGRLGRERVERHFEIRRMVAAYESLYESLSASGSFASRH